MTTATKNHLQTMLEVLHQAHEINSMGRVITWEGVKEDTGLTNLHEFLANTGVNIDYSYDALVINEHDVIVNLGFEFAYIHQFEYMGTFQLPAGEAKLNSLLEQMRNRTVPLEEAVYPAPCFQDGHTYQIRVVEIPLRSYCGEEREALRRTLGMMKIPTRVHYSVGLYDFYPVDPLSGVWAMKYGCQCMMIYLYNRPMKEIVTQICI